jgi:hypothetical protein
MRLAYPSCLRCAGRRDVRNKAVKVGKLPAKLLLKYLGISHGNSAVPPRKR